jgi:endonuclease-8
VSEGDAVHRTAALLGEALAGTAIREAVSPNPRAGLTAAAGRLEGATLDRVEARGKHLLLHFDNGLALHSHLGMSGSWHVYQRGERWRRPERSAWLVLRTAGADAAQFGGPRLALRREGQISLDPALRSLGPDVLADDFDPPAAVTRIRGAEQERGLGDALLDQTLIAGIGNIYKSEACFEAGIDPWRRLGALSGEELLRVVEAAQKLMRAGLESGGMPRRIYRGATRPCPRCGKPIRSRGQGDANRTTYWCPGCQR